MSGGTTEAPSWLTPAATGNTLPIGSDSWPHMQENYGAVQVGTGPTLTPLPSGTFPCQQDNGYQGASIASPITDPTIVHAKQP